MKQNKQKIKRQRSLKSIANKGTVIIVGGRSIGKTEFIKSWMKAQKQNADA